MKRDMRTVVTAVLLLIAGLARLQAVGGQPAVVDVRDHGRLLRIVGKETSDRCGIFIEVADLVGDSRLDLLVSSSGAEDPTDDYRGGRVDLFDGSTLPDVGLIDLENPIPRPWMTIYGEDDDGLFGSCIEIADFDGDGEPDLAVSAPTFRGTGERDSGRTYLFLSGGSGGQFLTQGGDVFAVDADVFIDGVEKAERTGLFLASGDLDGDGQADLVLGAPDSDDGRPEESGRVYVVHSRQDWSAQRVISLRDSLTTKSADPPLPFDTQIRVYTGERKFDRIGESLEAGDLNGDGLCDLVIGADHEDLVVESKDVSTTLNVGRVHIISGTEVFQGPPSTGETILSATSSNLRLVGKSEFDLFGDNLFVTDWNSDGIEDLWVSAPFAEPDPRGNTDDDFGIVSLISGSVTLLEPPLEKSNSIFKFAKSWMHKYYESSDLVVQLKAKIPVNFRYPDGHSLAVAGPEDSRENETLFGGAIFQGDVLGNDGVTELVIGASRFDAEGSGRDAGLVSVLTRGDLAGSVPTSPRLLAATPESVRIEGEEDSNRFGFRVRAADLLSGPGEELIVAAPMADSDVRTAGVVYIFNLEELAYQPDATASPTYAETATPIPTFTQTPLPDPTATLTPTPAPPPK